MPTQDISEHDFVRLESNTNVKTQTSLKEFFLGIINEREKKYEARFAGIDKSLSDTSQAIKEALSITTNNTKEALTMATSNTKEALVTATSNTRDALSSANASIVAMGNAIESRINTAMAAAKEAQLKYEKQVDEKFHNANEFRNQLNEQQQTFSRKGEVDIRFEALEKKLDTAIASLQINKGKELGTATVWGIVVVVLGLIISAGVIVAALVHH